ncbi:TetR/AcrR family transcriptional regulator [Actinophytocola sediminis]
MSAQPSRPTRSDVVTNRARIIAAAQAVLTENGVEVPVAAIARRAGVGVATVYRHFPSKAALVTAAFTDRVADCVTLIDEGLADRDPWRGFATTLYRLCAANAAQPRLVAAATRHGDAETLTVHRAVGMRGIARLIARAKTAGLSEDFTVDDIAVLLMANAGLTVPTTAARVAAAHRLVTRFLHGARAETRMP